MPAHVQVTTCLKGGGPCNDLCSCPHCTLAVCAVCGCYEGSLTTDCAGVKVDYDQQDKIFKEGLDYSDENGWYDRGRGLGWPEVNFKRRPNITL